MQSSLPIKRSTAGSPRVAWELALLITCSFYIFFGVNLVVALFPNLWAKLGVLAVMVSWILFTMVPDNPLRALFYTVAQGGVTLLAILVTQVIELRWTQRAFIHRVGQSPSTGVRD